ncbi:MAG: hypothetical protein COT74_12080 [Bdellovibrionales bacterium CG10_big_fil_rev_8_21_14_0_10_45_34]|nr:MAG: hypothetical protein COT74_12080 [Bdellovibrionales bacterium CG10_big_fil_rev_8_21_14_0_10_45_34]
MNPSNTFKQIVLPISTAISMTGAALTLNAALISGANVAARNINEFSALNGIKSTANALNPTIARDFTTQPPPPAIPRSAPKPAISKKTTKTSVKPASTAKKIAIQRRQNQSLRQVHIQILERILPTPHLGFARPLDANSSGIGGANNNPIVDLDGPGFYEGFDPITGKNCYVTVFYGHTTKSPNGIDIRIDRTYKVSASIYREDSETLPQSTPLAAATSNCSEKSYGDTSVYPFTGGSTECDTASVANSGNPSVAYSGATSSMNTSTTGSIASASSQELVKEPVISATKLASFEATGFEYQSAEMRRTQRWTQQVGSGSAKLLENKTKSRLEVRKVKRISNSVVENWYMVMIDPGTSATLASTTEPSRNERSFCYVSHEQVHENQRQLIGLRKRPKL